MKLFLASSPNLTVVQTQTLLELVGKAKLDKVLVINTGVVPYGLTPKPEWYVRSVDPLRAISTEVEEVSLIEEDIPADSLSNYDLIFVSGGNVFYLAYQLHETSWGTKISDYINNGGVYAGSSAGSIILTDNIEHFATADDPAKAPAICPGLGLLSHAIVPHADNAKYSLLAADIALKYRADGLEVILLNDNQVLVINGESAAIM